LAVMDAQHLGFPDAFFDAVVAQYVITTVPDPEAALDEFARVTTAGGEIILVNHLGADAGPRRVFEQSFAPVARRLGWRPEFRWQRLAPRTPPHAAARTFLADSIRAASSGWRRGRAGADGGRYGRRPIERTA
jgi:phosphatidylethanolamine/phosphatidyl-N-methylethanolamine N-methyltransferase